MNFNLKDTKAEITAIVVWLSYPTRWKYYPGLSITPSQWDKAKQRAKPQHPNRVMMNRLLDKIEKSIYDMWLQAVEADTHMTREQIKHKLDILLQKKEDTTNKLIPFCEQYIRQAKKAKNTLQNYRVALRHIRSYNPDLTFDDIDLDFFYKFREHLQLYKQNTVQSTIKNLKVFMQDAFDRGLHQNEAFRHKKFSVSKQEVPNSGMKSVGLRYTNLSKYHND